jgi:hypothetical protein
MLFAPDFFSAIRCFIQLSVSATAIKMAAATNIFFMVLIVMQGLVFILFDYSPYRQPFQRPSIPPGSQIIYNNNFHALLLLIDVTFQ